MREVLRNFIQRLFGLFGLRLVRLRGAGAGELVDIIERHGVRLVVDVGANAGQFAAGLLEAGYRGQILCFEPLEDAHERLRQRLGGHPQVTIGARVAIGAQEATAQLNVARNSVSSSLLGRLGSLDESAPASAYIDVEQVDICPLDRLLAERTPDELAAALLKIDTQGYEAQVLDGAAATLRQVRGVLLEMSLTPLYEGQALWRELDARLTDAGFTLFKIYPGFQDRASRRLLQFDGLYLRLED